jgi:dTDP-4-dehydrorhamnose reductase
MKEAGEPGLQSLEIWGGVECTVNRVEEAYFDQLRMSGHDRRPEDLRTFAALGLKTLRFPVLWERMVDGGPSDQLDGTRINWRWSDERLQLARELGLRVIVGFVHHGSGPRFTNLLDPEFPAKLAAFARQFAERYPWVETYTPINEPLTTARFSGLYGVWYPHARDDRRFFAMLVNECRATVEAMRAVRTCNHDARLLLTEDLGKIFSTPLLKYQAEFENERRWLSMDLLCGRLGPNHPLWGYCRDCGLSDGDAAFFAEAPVPPDLIGINHYITSNRFLDERLERYPPRCHGSNGRHRYADIEAVRVGAEIVTGSKELLCETWRRYRRPLALSEVHLGCTRDEQMRWLAENWRSAAELRAEGVDVRAVTAWSLLGSFEWNSLVTRTDGFYEPGVFDLRGAAPRPTALANMVQAFARQREFDHPVLDVPGWWHRPDRHLYPPVLLSTGANAALKAPPAVTGRAARPREILITGGRGTLATAFAFICERRGLRYRLASRQDLDAADADAVVALLDELRPWAVVNAAGYCRVDEAERAVDACFRDNVEAPAVLAAACAARGIKLLTFSSDLVFDGASRAPYTEGAAVAPLNVYGRSKAKAEIEVLSRMDDALVIRTSAFFGPWDEYNFLTLTLRRLARGDSVVALADQVVSPTYVPDLVNACLDLLIDGEKGVWHLANDGAVTWPDFARLATVRLGFDDRCLISVPRLEAGLAAARPEYSALGSARGRLLPDLEQAVARYCDECRVAVH